MYPAIHNLSPNIYSQLSSTANIAKDSGWEVVNDNEIATQWHTEWTMTGDDIIEESEQVKANTKKASDANKADMRALSGLVGHIMAPTLSKSGIGGNAGWLGYQKPFITIINKKPVGTEDLNKYIGLPIEAKKTIGDLSGYTEVSEIFLPQGTDTELSQDEISEIKNLLNRGVIL